jgi:O-antigen/teichoic acid export membrane protein
MSGRLAAMAIGIVGAPIVARLFAPSDYGIAAFFIAMMTIAAGVLPAGYNRAILFPREDRTAAELLMLTFAISILLSLGLYLVLGIVELAGLTLPGPLAGSALLWLLPLGAVLTAMRDAFYVLMIRRQEFGIIAWADVIQSGGTLLSRVLWGLTLGSAALGLVLGQFFGLLAGLLLTWAVCGAWLRTTMAGGTISALTRVAAEFSDYPKYRVSARLAFLAAEQTPVIALGLMYPAATVGFFAMAHRVADLPLQAASRALGDAILGDAISKRNDSKPLAPSVWKAAAGLAVVGIPTFSLMYLFGGEILTWFLGSRWAEAGRMVEILALYLFFTWMNAPFAPVFETLRMNKQYMLLYSLNLVARIAVFVGCFMAGLDIYATLWAFSIVCAGHSLLSIAVADFVVRRHDTELRQGQG